MTITREMVEVPCRMLINGEESVGYQLEVYTGVEEGRRVTQKIQIEVNADKTPKA